MVVFMFRPSPQCSTPSLEAAQRCFPACTWNIAMHRDQIKRGNVDMTWIFTQAMFMTINTILWTLSFEQIRNEHPREEVQQDLNVALECIELASERWPGVISALELYKSLIAACMRIYDQAGNVEISAASPSDTGPSQAASPVAQLASPFLPPARTSAPDIVSAYGSMDQMAYSDSSASFANGYTSTHAPRSASYAPVVHHDSNSLPTSHYEYNPQPQVPLPSTFGDLVSWNPDFDFTSAGPTISVPAMSPYDPAPHTGANANGSFFELASPSNVPWTDYLYPPSYEIDRSSSGLNEQQQSQLMESLQSTGVGMIEHIIDATNAVFYPPNRQQ
jgi:hypothetical protein